MSSHHYNPVTQPTRLPPGLCIDIDKSLGRPCNHPDTPSLHGAYQLCFTLPDGSSIIGRAVLDTGSVKSMTATMAGIRTVPIPLSQQPLIEGAGGGMLRATHWVYRGLPPAVRALLPDGAPDEVRFLYGPAFRFDVCATSELAALGVSTVVCADSGQVHLFPKGGDYRLRDRRVTCDIVEGLSAVPGDWRHAAPLVALPHLRPRGGTRGGAPRRRHGRTSNLADAAISAHDSHHRHGRRNRRSTRATAADADDHTSDASGADDGGDHADHLASPTSDATPDGDHPPGVTTDPEPDPASNRDAADRALDAAASAAPASPVVEHEPDLATTPPASGSAVEHPANDADAAAAADAELAADRDSDGAEQPHVPRRTRTTPGAGRAARLTKLQLAAARQRRQLHDAASDGPPRAPAPQLTPIDYGEARLLLGNPSHRVTTDILRAAGRRPVHVSRARPHLDELRARAGQMAQAMTHVPPTGLERDGGEVTWADTLGGKWPRSKAGNQYAMTWSFKSQPHKTYMSLSDNHEAASTWAGFREVCREAGVTVLERAVSQDIELVTDQGTEFLGVFHDKIARAGILHSTASAHKTKKHGAQAGELVNRNLQRFMRGGLMAARANFEAANQDGRDYWDYGLGWACRSMATRRRALATVHEAADDRDPTPPLSWQQIVRRNIAPFGARGFITIQAKDPKRSKPSQLADCAITGLFLGLTPNGKSRMLLPTGEVYVTSDVTFPVGAMVPTSGPVTFHDTEAWIAPFDTENDFPNSNVIDHNSDSLTSSEVSAAEAQIGNAHDLAVPFSPAATPDAAEGSAAITDPPDTRAPDHDNLARARDAGPSPIANEGATVETDPDSVSRNSGNAKTTKHVNVSRADADRDKPAEQPAEPCFADDSGAQIHVGDEVSVTRITGSIGSHRRTQHRGTVQEISADAEQYRVAYPDGSALWHPYTSDARAPVLRRALVGRSFDRKTHRPQERLTITLLARRPEPREEIRFALAPDGNIKAGYWDGTLTLPPEPPMPPDSPEDTPPCPETVFKALAHVYAIHWLHAAVRERRGHLAPINRPPTYHFTRQRPMGRRLMSKWVFTIKRHADNSIDKFKARECIAGWHLRRGTDYTESYSGMTPWSDVLDLESLAALLGLEVWEADLKQAYAFAPMPPTPNGTPVIAMSCPGVQVHDADGTLLHQQADQAWCGHPSAGFALAKHLHGALTGVNPSDGVEVCPVPFVQNPFQPCMFQAKYPADHPRRGELFILHVSTDNLRTYGSDPDIQADFMSWLRRQFEVTGGASSLRDQPPQKFMGCIFSYQDDGAVTIDMPVYIDALLNETGMRHANTVSTPMAKGFIVSLQDSPTTPDEQRAVIDYVNADFGTNYTKYADVISYYGHLVSSIGWITHRVGPIMQHAHSVLCRVLSAPSVQGFQGVKRLLRYLAGKTDMHRTYRPDRVYDWRNGDLPTWSIASDASFADDPHDRRGQGGYVGGYEGQAATTTTSKKTRRTCTAVDQAESDFAGSACKEAEYKRHWMGFFDILKPGPTTLTVDNFATFSRAGAPIRKWTPRSKQHDVNEKYVVECRERDVIRVKHSRGNLPEDPQVGEGFPPDAMTKALPRLPTEFYYDALHGRRSSPIGVRAVVDDRSLCTTLSDVHSHRSHFSGLVRVQYDDGTRSHVSPERIAFYKGEQ